MDRVRAYVADAWGHSLRPEQEEAISALLARRDVLVTLATGGGKSLCYQALASVCRHPILVVTPLRSLAQDQVRSLLQKGVRAVDLGDGKVEDGTQIVYSTPERAVRVAAEREWSLFAVDEAHCVDEWGADFRPEYGQLGSFLRPSSSPAPLIALTASATEAMLSRIQASLRLRPGFARVSGSFARPNLSFRSVEKGTLGGGGRGTDKYRDVRSLLDALPAIVYATSRAETEALASALSNFRAAPYHAGMGQEERKEVLEGFLDGSFRVVCATVAFGMGIDKADVRRVVHYGPPRSLEAYYQEAGRAGRDGRESKCVLLTSEGDWPRLRAAGADPTRLAEVEAFARGQRGCLHAALVSHFGEKAPPPCLKCGVCAGEGRAAAEAEVRAGKEEVDLLVALVSAFPACFGKRAIFSALLGKAETRPSLKAHPSFAALARRTTERRLASLLRSALRLGLLRTEERPLRAGGGTYTALDVQK